MSQRKIKLLETVTEAEILQLRDLIVEAFPVDDPGILGLLCGRLELAPEYQLASVRAAVLEGEVWIVEVDGKWVSIGLWFKWPNVLFSTEAQRNVGFNEFVKKLSPEAQHWISVEYGKQIKEWDNQKKVTDEKLNRAWYCNLLATHPGEQGHGHATALVNHILAEVKKRNNGMLYLATPSKLNVDKYKSMGFTERGHITMHTTVNSFRATWLTKDA